MELPSRNIRIWRFATAAMLGVAIAFGILSSVLFDENRKLRVKAPRVAPAATAKPAAITPVINVAVLNLSPDNPTRVPADAEQLTLILHVEGGAKHADYGVEIMRVDASPMWHSNGLRRSRENTFTIHLPRSFLTKELYQVKLYGIDGAARVLMQTYALDLR